MDKRKTIEALAFVIIAVLVVMFFALAPGKLGNPFAEQDCVGTGYAREC